MVGPRCYGAAGGERFGLRENRRWWRRYGSVVPLLLLGGCAGEKKAIDEDSAEPTPACEQAAWPQWSPTLEAETRFEAETAAWLPVEGGAVHTSTDDETIAADSVAVIGGATSSLILNKVSYNLSGSITATTEARLLVLQTNAAGEPSIAFKTAVHAGQTVTLADTFAVTSNTETVTVQVEVDDGGTASLTGVRIEGTQWAFSTDTPAAPLALGFLIHIEEQPSLMENQAQWASRARVVEGLSQMLASHGAKLTLQPDATFIAATTKWNPEWVTARAAEGMGWSIHFHETDGGAAGIDNSVRAALAVASQAGLTLTDMNGGFTAAAWETVANDGVESLSAFKNSQTQAELGMATTQPWRPAEGSGDADEAAFETPTADGPVVYLPGTSIRENDHARFANFAERHLSQALAHARPDFVNTWYFIEHVDGFGPGNPDEFGAYMTNGDFDADLAEIDAFFTETADPLVAAGSLAYATTTEMSAEYLDWEHPCR